MIDHDEADALLAGYVLGSLSGPDAAEADWLLSEHVPECNDCRATLDAFQGVTGELGLATPAASPPDTLLVRLHRSVDGRRSRGLSPWSPTRVIAAVAAAIFVVGVAGLAIARSGDSPEQQLLSQADLAHVQELVDKGAHVKNVGTEAQEVVGPGLEELYLMGTGIEPPPAGFTYRAWIVNTEGVATWAGDFVPANGNVVFRVEVDPATVDHLLVTVEPSESEPSQPGTPAWPAA